MNFLEDQLKGLRKVLDGVDHWLNTYREDDNRIEMWKHRHVLIEAITELQIKLYR